MRFGDWRYARSVCVRCPEASEQRLSVEGEAAVAAIIFGISHSCLTCLDVAGYGVDLVQAGPWRHGLSVSLGLLGTPIAMPAMASRFQYRRLGAAPEFGAAPAEHPGCAMPFCSSRTLLRELLS